jgi:retron-type reverse transcriptase
VIDAKTKVTLPYDIVEYLVETKSKLLSANLSAQTTNYLVEILSRKGVSIDEYLPQKNKMDKQPGGVPQGSPLSPFLAILAIRPYLSQQKCVNYADDQIFYSDEYFEIKDDPANGIIHNQDKSG